VVLGREKTKAAVISLNAFSKQGESQSGKKMSKPVAAELIQGAQEIITLAR
jgi:hypothetical protein